MCNLQMYKNKENIVKMFTLENMEKAIIIQPLYVIKLYLDSTSTVMTLSFHFAEKPNSRNNFILL